MSKVLVSITVFAAIAAAWGFAFRALTVFFRRESTRRHDGPTRVQLIDFLALFVALAPALVFLSVAIRAGWMDATSVPGIGGPLLLAFLALWWQGVRLLSNLGIHDAVRRALFLGALFPVMLVAAPIAAMFLVGSISLLSMPEPPLWSWLGIALSLAAVGGLLGVGIRYVHSGIAVDKSDPRAEFND